ncbi:hypothetical protein N7492_001192 [Penicillium capsulatum]|uniref:DSC E3 ubiquitin ligase complex subunit 2 n=1 Tax=Penicillium capsulatum TaxID=69766 RepID=A0A9W9IU77_9EURO|nr:hypothetical protein N7492_001192 [Penicillium capsulatum]KAJ6129751.1 hypothetical protein N7512_002531 [Penicillium capsulatum]
MLTSGLTNTPLTKALIIYTIASSIALSILDVKHLASIHVSPHFWPYVQLWRACTWQVAGFANSTEALFGAMLVYHLRVVERAWGKRKMATFLLTTLPYTTLLPPLLLALVARPLSLNTLNYLPSGPTATIFALLAQYHATIPHIFRYRIGTSASSPVPRDEPSDDNASSPSPSTPKPTPPSLTLLLSDKSTTYIVAAQLALSQFPSMLLPAAVGWIVGVAWRAELLPGLSPSATGFRVPAWVVGERERRPGNGGAGSAAERERYEDLRRRLEGEVAASTGLEGGSGTGQRRRNAGDTSAEGNGREGFVERLRGAW